MFAKHKKALISSQPTPRPQSLSIASPPQSWWARNAAQIGGILVPKATARKKKNGLVIISHRLSQTQPHIRHGKHSTCSRPRHTTCIKSPIPLHKIAAMFARWRNWNQVDLLFRNLLSRRDLWANLKSAIYEPHDKKENSLLLTRVRVWRLCFVNNCRHKELNIRGVGFLSVHFSVSDLHCGSPWVFTSLEDRKEIWLDSLQPSYRYVADFVAVFYLRRWIWVSSSASIAALKRVPADCATSATTTFQPAQKGLQRHGSGSQIITDC